ncbi:unnamed protein product [Symbiodinium sp. CCMP2592]|nr:unnamed protein product [Symbiodinium sp. CCMP2592]
MAAAAPLITSLDRRLAAESSVHFQWYEGTLVIQALCEASLPHPPHATAGWQQLVDGEPQHNAICNEVHIPGPFLRGHVFVARQLEVNIIVTAGSVETGQHWVAVVERLLERQKGPRRVKRLGAVCPEHEYARTYAVVILPSRWPSGN